MRINFTTSVRAMLLAAALAFAVPFAIASSATNVPHTVATRRTASDTVPADRDDTPIGGILIIAGIVAGVIALAWVCSRVSDNRSLT